MSTEHSDRSPGRPTEYAERVTKVVRFEHELNDRLKEAAAARGVSVNLMITWAVTEYLDRLPPVEAVLKTTDPRRRIIPMALTDTLFGREVTYQRRDVPVASNGRVTPTQHIGQLLGA